MPMGIVSDKEFDSALKDSRPKSTNTREESNSVPTVVPLPEKGRGHNPEVPNALRQVIGEESAINGRDAALEMARQFGISPSAVSAYANGATSTASYNDRPNLPVINQAKERIAKRARGKLMKALNKITDDKLDSASAKDLAGIAKDMSAVVRTMEPEQPKSPTGEGSKGPTFVFYAPQFHKEEHYDIVHAKE